MQIIVGGIIEKDNKVLLVQEMKQKCFGKWNIPAGHLEKGESIFQGAIREIKEETGCDVELTGLALIIHEVMEEDISIGVVFTTKLINENTSFNPTEIMDVKWWDVEDVLNNMDDELRNLDFIKNPLKNIKENKVESLDIIKII